MGIFNVSVAAINHPSGGVNDGYRDYACTVGTSLRVGQDYSMTVTTNANSDENVRAWLDLNNDGQFNATTELIFSSSGRNAQTQLIRLPAAGATMGVPLRLRIAADYVNAPVPTPCSTPQYSQTEDYRVTLQANTQAPAASFVADQPLTCTGCVQFTDQSQNVPTAWQWNFGDGTSSTQQNPSKCYPVPGTYTVVLTAANAYGAATSTRASYIVYNNILPVVAHCAAPTANYCCGYGITQFTLGGLTNTSVDGAAGYQDFTCTQRLTVQAGGRYPWAVRTGGGLPHDVRAYLDLNDDGQFSSTELLFQALNQRNPTGEIDVPLAATRNRPLRLRVVAGGVGTGVAACGGVSAGQAEDYTVTVVANTSAPALRVASSYQPSCDTLVAFTDQSANLPTTWQWLFGDGTSSTQQNPRHVYAQPGNYRVRLRACNAFGCDTLAAPLLLRINGRAVRPAACTLTITRPQDYPSYSIREFQLHTIDNITGDATQGYGNFTCSHRALLTAGGRYPVLVRGPAPIENFRSRVWIDYNNDGVFTEPAELVLSGDANEPLHRGIVQVPASAVANVPLRVRVLGAFDGPALGPCSTLLYGQVEEYSVIIRPATVPVDPWFTISQDSACAGGSIGFQLTNRALPTGSTISWAFGDGGSSTVANPTHAYAQAGTYRARATLCSGGSCLPAEQSIFVTAAHVTRPGTCAGISGVEGWGLKYGMDSVRVGPLRFANRDFAHLYRDLSCGQHALVQPGQTYPIAVAGRTAEERTLRVYFDANDDGAFAATELLFTANAITGSFAGNITIPGAAVRGIPLRLRVLTDSDRNGSDACSVARGQVVDFSLTVGLTAPLSSPASPVTARQAVYTTPNPINGECIVHVEPSAGPLNVTLLNTAGKIVYFKKYAEPTAKSGEITLPVASLLLATGIYILQVEFPGKRQYCKVALIR